MLHLDIKPENILVDNSDRVKIADFGIAKVMKDKSIDSMSNIYDTKFYQPPEIFSNNVSKSHENKIDIWSIGVTFFSLAFGCLPFTGNDAYTLKYRIINDKPIYPDDADRDFVNLLKKCLIKNPYKRPNIQEIMEDNWITQNGLNPLELEK